VGKAIDLYHRVSSYFSFPRDPKTLVLAGEIRSLDTIVVESELEALILEANLIKKYLPKFNIRLTDDKDYLYIKVSRELFPGIITARKKELSGSLSYFGPFPSARTVRETLKSIRRVFPWCANPPNGNKVLRPCFYYHINLCPGACAGEITQKNYRKIINRFIQFMKGRRENLVNILTAEMNEASRRQEYEQAAQLKRTLNGITYLTQPNRAHIYLENPNFLEDQREQALEDLRKNLGLGKTPERIEGYDVSNLGGQEAVASMVVLTSGEIDKKEYRKFRILISNRPNDVAMMREVIRRRLKHAEWSIPDLIMVDGGKGQVNAANSELLTSKFEIPVVGLAKRMEWLYRPDAAIVKLPKSSPALKLLQKLRDESHRFAITYHRKLRQRALGLANR